MCARQRTDGSHEEDGNDEVVSVALEIERLNQRLARSIVVERSTAVSFVRLRVNLRIAQVGSITVGQRLSYRGLR